MTTAFPHWLEWSGLPGELNDKVRVGAWSVFKKIVELDCERNRRPDAVEISISHLAEVTGLSHTLTRRILDGLRKKKLLLVFLPESDDEVALLQIRVPLRTPMTVEEVAEAHPELHLDHGSGDARYAHEDKGLDPEDPAIRRVVDLYLDRVSMKMNSFILDELIFIAQRFQWREIDRVFRQAAHLRGGGGASPSLGWIARELRRRHGKKKTE